MPNTYADLELGLHRWDATQYLIEFRFSLPDSDAEIRLTQSTPALATFDFEALRAQVDYAQYGQALSQSLFTDANVLAAFLQALSTAQAQDLPLRVRLLIGPSAPELHALRWETLYHPQDKTPLFTGENILFSRYLSSLDWRPVRLRPQGDLRALILVANPSDLEQYRLAVVDVPGEVGRAKEGLGNIPTTVLDGTTEKPTLTNLLTRIRDDQPDIVYIVAHGALIKNEPYLWLEDDAGKTARTSGADLVVRFKELANRPRMVVLASCQSASATSEGSLSAVGPRLAEAGISAVVAMQGNVSMETVKQLMPVFFSELQKDGMIDRALALARGATRQRPDYWMPTLFMRLKTGRIWYVPGFGDDRKSFEKWPAIIRSVKKGQATPIIGPGVVESLIGSTREIARRWAETYHFPLEPHEREDLPQVAQYLAVNQDRAFPRDELSNYLRQELQTRYAADLSEALRSPQAALAQVFEAVGAKRRAQDTLEAHRVLASMPFPIFVTTNSDNLLAHALREAGKKPEVELCPWNEYIEPEGGSIYQREPDYRPTPERPLVYHLFGQFENPDSLVLTEDDYFDYLMGVTTNKDLIPAAVRRALADTALVFLGFQMDDWNFRVLFRSIMGQGGGRRSRYAHVAAQIEPEEGRILEPERARRYLETYFQSADISLFWGSAEDFVRELARQANAPGR